MKKWILPTALVIISMLTGCMGLFQDTGINVTNNTGASITVEVVDTAAAGSSVVGTATIANGETTLIDLSSDVPVFGSVTIGATSDDNYRVYADGKYCYDLSQGASVNAQGETDSVTFTANAAYVTITNNSIVTFQAIYLGSTSSFSSATMVSSDPLANGETISLSVSPSQDYFFGAYTLTDPVVVDLNILSSEVGTDVTRSTN